MSSDWLLSWTLLHFKDTDLNRKIWENDSKGVKIMPAKVNKNKCTGCGTCVDECPVEAITLDEEEGIAVVNEDECVDCGACEDVCPADAIKVE